LDDKNYLSQKFLIIKKCQKQVSKKPTIESDNEETEEFENPNMNINLKEGFTFVDVIENENQTCFLIINEKENKHALIFIKPKVDDIEKIPDEKKMEMLDIEKYAKKVKIIETIKPTNTPTIILLKQMMKKFKFLKFFL
jgi:hypothetical protein